VDPETAKRAFSRLRWRKRFVRGNFAAAAGWGGDTMACLNAFVGSFADLQISNEVSHNALVKRMLRAENI
jgi:hypothetical protein